MCFSNEFLKWLIADIIDQCDTIYQDADRAYEIMKSNTQSADYNFSLGQRSVAFQLRSEIIDKLARKSIEREES